MELMLHAKGLSDKREYALVVNLHWEVEGREEEGQNGMDEATD
jgi:hypothetical protein